MNLTAVNLVNVECVIGNKMAHGNTCLMLFKIFILCKMKSYVASSIVHVGKVYAEEEKI